MSDHNEIEQLSRLGADLAAQCDTPLAPIWNDGAQVQPVDGEPVLVVATGHKGERYFDVMCYDQQRGQWTSPDGIVVWWHPKMKDYMGAERPAPWWLPLPPPPAPSPKGQIALL